MLQAEADRKVAEVEEARAAGEAKAAAEAAAAEVQAVWRVPR